MVFIFKGMEFILQMLNRNEKYTGVSIEIGLNSFTKQIKSDSLLLIAWQVIGKALFQKTSIKLLFPKK